MAGVSNRHLVWAMAAVFIAASCQPAAQKKADPNVAKFAAARSIVRDLLRDPRSAQFQRERVGKKGAVCGQVNAKNTYGGYVGFADYVYDPETKAAHVRPEEPDYNLEGEYITSPAAKEHIHSIIASCEFKMRWMALCESNVPPDWKEMEKICRQFIELGPVVDALH